MQSAVIVGGQVSIMFLLALSGFCSCKAGYFDQKSAKDLSSFLLNIAFPAVMISSFYRPKEQKYLMGLGLVFVLAVLMHLLAIVLSKLIIKDRGGFEPHAERFAVVYSNLAFIGIPIIRAALGEEATFYSAPMVAVFLTLHWTHGIVEMGGQFKIEKLTKNPCIIGIITGFLLFWFEIPLPGPVIETVKLLGGLTTPISMIVAGIYLSYLDPRELFDKRLFWTSFLRNLFVPLICIAAIAAAGCSGWFSGARVAVLAAVYTFGCPVASSVILLSSALEKDAVYPTKLFSVSTILSLATLPLLAAVADMLI